ncbi:ABC transporter ATP-binding protein/permease [Peptoniphilus sp. EMRHCC_23]|uniref:ABC transporter ATP-binding protein n=1 Tax=Peptoniphilus rachelemmaiella TaxID=2811779 RepID=UPI001C008148|nr:ABC transporter ATP-binding protein [Peptoniphilus rachelemmaiella]
MNKQRKKGIIDYIFQFAGEQKSTYIKSIIFALIGVFFSLTPYILMGDMVKKLFLGERDFYVYLMEGLIMAVLWIFRVVFHTLSTNISHRTTFKLIGNVRILLIDKLSRLPLGTVQGMPSGELKNIICERTDSMEPILAHVVPEFTANICAPIMLFIYILTLDWRMAFLSLATLPIAGIAMIWMLKDKNVQFQKTQTTTKVLNDTAVEYVGGIEVIKAFGKAESSYKRFADAAKENANSFIEWMRACVIPFSLGMVIAPATLLSVLPTGALFTMNGSLSLTEYIMILIISCGLISPLITVMSYNDDITKATSIFTEIDDILNLTELKRPEISNKLNTVHDITLNNVSFGYGEKEVLHNFSLKIPDGTVTALVGPSGSGKSTVARLIASLWDVQGGNIKIGGVDIRDMSLSDYNAQIAYVSQDSFLFNTSIRENIRMGKPSASNEEVEKIARKSGCYDFIMGLENGFDTIVGGSGAHLSGGERQRISIARAMLKNSPILILDEATAYTDPENEAIIQKSISELSKEKTLIVIAHRLSTIIDADQIVVIKDGNIEAKGTHTELLNSSSLYKNMWKAHIYARDVYEARGGVLV